LPVFTVVATAFRTQAARGPGENAAVAAPPLDLLEALVHGAWPAKRNKGILGAEQLAMWATESLAAGYSKNHRFQRRNHIRQRVIVPSAFLQ
jgi:hypothetical protein